MKPDAPLLFEDMITRGIEPAPTRSRPTSPSGSNSRWATSRRASPAADVVIEKEFKTAAVHQGYIEPHACVAKVEADGQGEIWSSSQGHFQMRALTAQILGVQDRRHARHPGRDRRRVRRQDRHLPGTGGRAAVEEVRPAGAPADDARGRVQGAPARPRARRCGSRSASPRTARSSPPTAIFKFQAGAFPGSPVMNACLCAYSPYDIPNARAVGYDVVSATGRNRRPIARPARRSGISRSRA